MTPLGRRGGALVVAVSVLAAILARWPLSIHPDALPLDPNSGLHALTVDSLRDGSFTRVFGIQYPDGAPLRLIGLPALLLALPLVDALGASAALEVARTAWLALQGVAVGALAARLGLGLRGALVAAALAVLNPFVLHASGNGQHENVALAALALAVWAGLGPHAGVGGAWRAGFAVVVSGICSPYHVVSAGVLLVVTAASRGRRALGAAVAGALAGGLPVAAYYAAALAPTTNYGRPIREITVSAPLFELVFPRASLIQGFAPSRPALARLADAFAALPRVPLDAAWPFTTPTSAPYLGIGLLLVGILGVRGAARPIVAVGLAGLGCLMLACGPRLRYAADISTAFPLPWAAFAWAPGLGDLTSTARFLSGAVLALVLGAGALAARRAWTAWLVPLVVADALLVAPIEWPARAAWPVLGVLEQLPEGPVAVWPPVGPVPEQLHTLLAVAVGRPVVLPRTGEGDVWRPGVARALVQFLPPDGTHRWSDAPGPGRGTCVGGACMRVLPTKR